MSARSDTGGSGRSDRVVSVPDDRGVSDRPDTVPDSPSCRLGRSRVPESAAVAPLLGVGPPDWWLPAAVPDSASESPSIQRIYSVGKSPRIASRRVTRLIMPQLIRELSASQAVLLCSPVPRSRRRPSLRTMPLQIWLSEIASRVL